MKLIADRSVQQEYRSLDVHQRSLDRFIMLGKNLLVRGNRAIFFLLMRRLK